MPLTPPDTRKTSTSLARQGQGRSAPAPQTLWYFEGSHDGAMWPRVRSVADRDAWRPCVCPVSGQPRWQQGLFHDHLFLGTSRQQIKGKTHGKAGVQFQLAPQILHHLMHLNVEEIAVPQLFFRLLPELPQLLP